MKYTKVKDKLLLVVLTTILVKGIAASDNEGSNSQYNDNSTRNSQYNDNSSRSQEASRNSQRPPQYSQPQTQAKPLGTLRYNPNSNNGALFGPTTPFPVMDANGHVTYTPPPNQQQQQQNYSKFSGYVSSENTPQFPSLMGRRLKGLPTHFDSNLNTLLTNNDAVNPQNQQQQQQHVIPAVQTDELDQGPLAPPPKSPMEQAGWWEYLALLFGDSGDPTALRLILHRLTKLAQLQVEPAEAVKVQAATAFLAEHFKPLLVNSFQDFVYDPDYTRNSAMWSADPGFSLIIRRLVDQMDYYGAQQELDRIFGPNTSVAVSFGMRQPEWLRLKLIMEQIAWDIKHPNDLIGLWSTTWNLSVPQKLAILSYASNPRGSTPLDLNLPHRDLVLARINLITNGEVPRDQNLIKQESPLDQAHYQYAIQQASGNLCAQGHGREQGNASNGNPNGASSATAEGLKKRVGDYCELINLTPNFVQFCQTGPNDSTPIASLLSAASPLFDSKVIAYINHLERLFWSFTWTGSCSDARESLATLTNQIKVLGPREELVKKGRIVPPGVADSIHVRLEYMQAVQQTCQNNLQLHGSADVAHIFSLLNYGHLDEALAEWNRRFSSVAPRLEGYPGGSIVVGGEGQLLYQQARDVRISLLVYKYPRSVYVPCLSKGLLTRDPGTDLTLLNLTHSLDTHKPKTGTTIDPLLPEMSARSLYMRALYLSGRHLETARVAREIAAVGGDKLVDEFLACTQLCGTKTRNPCEAEKKFEELIRRRGENGRGEQGQYDNQQQQQPQPQQSQAAKPNVSASIYSAGKELSTRLCRLSRNTASDALSLRYGKVLTTQSTFTALKRFFDANSFGGDGYGRGLKAGRAISILPWFGTLPPAPVDDILSFVPTRKLNFVSEVGINGIPVIKPPSNANENPSNTGNDKIFVLGKEYSADILTDTNGNGTTQPKTKLVNGMFQLATNTNGNSSSQQGQQGQQASQDGQERGEYND